MVFVFSCCICEPSLPFDLRVWCVCVCACVCVCVCAAFGKGENFGQGLLAVNKEQKQGLANEERSKHWIPCATKFPCCEQTRRNKCQKERRRREKEEGKKREGLLFFLLDQQKTIARQPAEQKLRQSPPRFLSDCALSVLPKRGVESGKLW